MRIVGPFAAARQLDPATGFATPSGTPLAPAVTTWQAFDRITGMPALLYLLPYGTPLPALPDSPLLLPYSDSGSQDKQNWAACDLPPTAQNCVNAELVTQKGLRALMALHEAGLVHGSVTPQQFWEDDGQLLLSGAGLPWSELPEPYRAPEGGRSAAADLYAFAVTLLRLGPLPEGLSDLLSPYPAQRPSARDALALMNAGPRLPALRGPLVVDAPRAKLPPEVVSAVEPLPLVADPDFRAPDIDLQDTVLIPDTRSRLERQRREQAQPPRVADLPPVLVPQESAVAVAPAEAEAHTGPRVVRIVVPAEGNRRISEEEQGIVPPVAPLSAPPLKMPASREAGRISEPLLPAPKLGLADAIPVRGRVSVRPTGPERRPVQERLGEVLKPVKPEAVKSAPNSLEAEAAQRKVTLPKAAENRPAIETVGTPAARRQQQAQPSAPSQPSELSQPREPQKAPEPVQPAPVESAKAAPVQAALVVAVPELVTPEPESVVADLSDDQTQPAEVAALPEVPVPEPEAEWSESEWVEEWSSEGLVYSTLPPEEQPQPIAQPAPETETVPAAPAVPVGTLPSRRAVKPVKMVWNPDGSWQVKHDDEAQPPAPVNASAEVAPLESAKVMATHAGQVAAKVLRGVGQAVGAGVQSLLERRKAGGKTSSQQALARLKKVSQADQAAVSGAAETTREAAESVHLEPSETPSVSADPTLIVLSDETMGEAAESEVAAPAEHGEQTAHIQPEDKQPDEMVTVPAVVLPELLQAQEEVKAPVVAPDAVPVESLSFAAPSAEAVQDLPERSVPEVTLPTVTVPGVSLPTPPRPVVKVVSRAEAEGLPRLLDDLDFPDIQPVIRQDEPEEEERPILGKFLPKRAEGQDVPPRTVRVPRWVWAALLVLLLLGLLLWAFARRNAQVGEHITAPSSSNACCSLQMQVFSPEGERLSVPVEVTAHSVPEGSRLQQGANLGRAPGTITMDAAGEYTLGLHAESYQPAQVKVQVPRTTPLNITLQ